MDKNYVIVYNWMIYLGDMFEFTAKELSALGFIFSITSNGKDVFTGASFYMCKFLEIDIFKYNAIIEKFRRCKILFDTECGNLEFAEIIKTHYS
jgi:hypothetical protein